MADIRVDDNFFDHPKTVRFLRRTDDHGIVCLTRLWCYTSRYFPKGILIGLTAEDIAVAAGWKHDPQEFVAALLEAGGNSKAGFLDRVGSDYAIHNWKTRNGYAYYQKERSAIARRAASARWDKKVKPLEDQDPNAERNAERNAVGNAVSNAERNAPAPAPAPSPTPKEKSREPALPPSGSVPEADREEQTGAKELPFREIVARQGRSDLLEKGNGRDKGVEKVKVREADNFTTEQKAAIAAAHVRIQKGSPVEDEMIQLQASCGLTSAQVDQVEGLLKAGDR